MEIKHAIEKEDGTYVYQGSFSGKELDFLVEYAINALLAIGAFPFVMEEMMDNSDVHAMSETEQ